MRNDTSTDWLKRTKSIEEWKHVDGSLVNLNFFSTDQPKEFYDCAAIWTYHESGIYFETGKLHSFDCEKKLPFVCKKAAKVEKKLNEESESGHSEEIYLAIAFVEPPSIPFPF